MTKSRYMMLYRDYVQLLKRYFGDKHKEMLPKCDVCGHPAACVVDDNIFSCMECVHKFGEELNAVSLRNFMIDSSKMG